MSKKFELLRRNENHSMDGFNRKPLTLRRPPRSASANDSNKSATLAPQSSQPPPTISNNSFKTFFHRIGSTGMLNRTQAAKPPLDTRTLYRSSSTSQLNTSSYIKGDDPTDGINLGNGPKNVHVSTENMNAMSSESVTNPLPIKAASYDDIARVTNTGDIQSPQPLPPTKRANFPYAFLRSRLSVLPEENGGSVINPKRIMQTTLNRENSLNEMSTKSKMLESGDNMSAKDHSMVCKWEQTTMQPTMINSSVYQRFNSNGLSSNESGYDSDSRHTDDRNAFACTENENANVQTYRPPKQLPSVVNAAAGTATPAKLPANIVRRRRIRCIPLTRKTITDCVGIVLTPQFYSANEPNILCRYVVTEIRGIGLAHADGRLRIGDEIVNVNGQDLRTMQSYEAVQQLLESFIDNKVELVIAHDELTTHTIYNDTTSVIDEKLDAPCDGGPIYESIDSSPSLDVDKNATDSDFSLQSDDVYATPKCRINELLPLQNYTDYVPVYGNRTSIANTISDDEKWQKILSRKRSEFLSKYGYAQTNRDNESVFATIPNDNNNNCNDGDDGQTMSRQFSEVQKRFPIKCTGDVKSMVKALDRMSTSITTEMRQLDAKSATAHSIFSSEYRSIRFDRDAWRKQSNQTHGHGARPLTEYVDLTSEMTTNKRSLDESITIKPINGECDIDNGYAECKLLMMLYAVSHL